MNLKKLSLTLLFLVSSVNVQNAHSSRKENDGIQTKFLSYGVCIDGTNFVTTKEKDVCNHHKGLKSIRLGSPLLTNQIKLPENNNNKIDLLPESNDGLVWLNTKSNIYHCSNDRYYGKTKVGLYLSEGDAINRGGRAANGLKLSCKEAVTKRRNF